MTHADELRAQRDRVVEAAKEYREYVVVNSGSLDAEVDHLLALEAETCLECSGEGWVYGLARESQNPCPAGCDVGRRVKIAVRPLKVAEKPLKEAP